MITVFVACKFGVYNGKRIFGKKKRKYKIQTLVKTMRIKNEYPISTPRRSGTVTFGDVLRANIFTLLLLGPVLNSILAHLIVKPLYKVNRIPSFVTD